MWCFEAGLFAVFPEETAISGIKKVLAKRALVSDQIKIWMN